MSATDHFDFPDLRTVVDPHKDDDVKKKKTFAKAYSSGLLSPSLHRSIDVLCSAACHGTHVIRSSITQVAKLHDDHQVPENQPSLASNRGGAQKMFT